MDGADEDLVPEHVPEDVEPVRLRDRQERNRSMVQHGRRIGGMPGAMMAGAMIALRDIYEGPVTDEIVSVSETPDEPADVDRDGLSMTVEGIAVTAPALPATRNLIAKRRRRRSRTSRRDRR